MLCLKKKKNPIKSLNDYIKEYISIQTTISYKEKSAMDDILNYIPETQMITSDSSTASGESSDLQIASNSKKVSFSCRPPNIFKQQTVSIPTIHETYNNQSKNTIPFNVEEYITTPFSPVSKGLNKKV